MILNEVFLFRLLFFFFFFFQKGSRFFGKSNALLITSYSIPSRLIFCESVFVIQQEEEEEA